MLLLKSWRSLKNKMLDFLFFKYRYDGYQFLTEKTIFHILQLDRIFK